MRFMFSSTRGTGHVQPLLPYARALLARGHDVIVAAPGEVSGPLSQAGIAHAAFDHPGEERLGPIWSRLRHASQEEAMGIAMREIFAGLNAQIALPKLQQAIESWRPDLIVRDSVEFAALIAAEKAGLRHARVAVHLVSFEDRRVDAEVGQPLAVLRAAAGLAADDNGTALRSELCFSAFPESLDGPCAGDAGRPAPIRTRMPEEEPSPAHARWRPWGADSLPLVYISFGTILGTMSQVRPVYRLALDAVAELPIRAVLTTGPGLEPGALGSIPANVQVESWIPQRDVLEHASAVVCHGGSGTVRGALASGLPLVVIPFGADQPYNAQRVAAVGAGLALTNPDVGAVRAAVERVLVDRELLAGAKKMAAEIAALPPLEHAVDTLVALAGTRA